MRKGRVWCTGPPVGEPGLFNPMTPEERERRKVELIEQIKAEKDLTRYADLIDELIRFLKEAEPHRPEF